LLYKQYFPSYAFCFLRLSLELMRLSKKAIDKAKKPCYRDKKGEILALIIEPKGELNKKRLLMALNLILSEKDVIDFFEAREHSSRTAQKRISKKRKANSL